VTDSSHIVPVKLADRSYDILVGTRNLTAVGDFLCQRADVSHAVVITDAHVEQPHAACVVDSLADADLQVDLLVVEAGETSKSIDMVSGLWEKMLELGVDRKAVVVAVGGGVIGDLAGFVASTYGRGISLMQVPTTLLAQVDSSVGGKVGINLPGAKNMVGAFWQPRGVLIDTAVLETLPDREYRSGLAEVVKYGVILDAAFFEYLEANIAGLNDRDAEVLRHVVTRCCEMKAEVVGQDERDQSGQRAVLNYGHTFCHAIETVCGYGEYLHGEAVAIGMICASRLAERLGRIEASLTARQRDLLTALKLPVDVPDVDHDALIEAMSRDKKVEHGRLFFVLPSRLGHVELVGDAATEDARAALSDSHSG
jgi:3-dehydroquinate synthase